MSGKLNLNIPGHQSIHITDNPEHSHFLQVFKKHTKFAFTTREQTLNTPIFGETSTCYIPTDVGDLITGITLRYKFYIRASEPLSVDDYNILTYNAGIHAIEYADLFIGGTLIERLTGNWIYTYHKFHSNEYNFRDGIDYYTQGINHDSKQQGLDHIWNMRQMYIDLPFYFHNNLSSSILTCKLQRQNCYIRIKFRDANDICIFQRDTLQIKDFRIETASLLTKYVFLGRDELNYLKNHPISQLITQVQLKRHDIHENVESVSVNLKFKNPIKIIYFFIGKKDKTYTINDNIVYHYMRNIEFKDVEMVINNVSLFNCF